jgi:thiol-disulfide isomerase/thioredoxin
MDARTERSLTRLATAASLISAVAVVATLLVVLWPRVTRAIGMEPKAPPPAYSAGTTIDTPADWYAHEKVTLVLFARNSCGACQKAAPYLKTLAATVTSSGGHVVFASTGNEPADDLRFAQTMGLEPVSVKVTPKGLRVRATPTLVLVNARGEILSAWEGVGDDKKQHAITTRVTDALKGA